MADCAKITAAIARRDFLARLVLIDPVYLPLFERADQKVFALRAEEDPVAAARAIAQRKVA